jgi:alpha-mannosidase
MSHSWQRIGRRALLTLLCCLAFAGAGILAQTSSPAASAPPSPNQQTATPPSAPSPAVKTNIKTIYIIPSSHWDLGFFAPPEEVLPMLKPHLDQVVADAKADPEFRWTIESVWQIREWLARTKDPREIQDFVDLVKKGQIQVSAVFGSMHSEFLGAETLNRLAYDDKALEKQLGIKTDLAMMDDVPGFTLRLPQVLAGSGVKYFVTGSNLFLFGGTTLSPAHVPFYWQAPDGSRVLTWQTQSRFGGYTEALADYYLDPPALEPYTKEHFYPKEWEGLPRLEIMQRGVDKLLKKYGDANYPYDAVMILFLHDFLPPAQEEDSMLPGIREWNASGRQPRIVMATPAEFFQHLESTYGDKFPVYSGDWSGLWSEVKTNSPRISAAIRWTEDHAPAAEMLWTLLTFKEGVSYPAGNFEAARLDVLKYDEHSGAAQVGWPKLMSRAEIDQQNKEYAQYARDAESGINQLVDDGMQALFSQTNDAPSADNVVVFNPSSWERDGIVDIAVPDRQKVQVRDVATKQLATAQRDGPRQWSFLAQNVSGTGYRTYALEFSSADEHARANSKPGDVEVESRYYRVRIRESDGAVVSVFDKLLGVDLVDPKSVETFNALSRWNPFGALPAALGKPEIAREDGPLSSSLIIRRPGSYWPETRITLPTHEKLVEFRNTLDRARMPYVASLQPGEYYSFDFPVKFDGPAAIWVEDGAGYHEIPDDYLPGARTDAAAPQHSLVLSGDSAGKKITIVLAQRESFFDYLPGLPGAKGPGKFLNLVRALALRKQDEGDTRDLGMVNFANLEPGFDGEPLRFTFALTSNESSPEGLPIFTESYQTAAALDLPLLAARLLPHTAPAKPAGAFFTLSASNVAIAAFKPSTDGNPDHYVLRLQEIAGQNTDVQITTPLQVSEAARTNLTEDEVLSALPLPIKISITPHQTITLRLTIPHKSKTRSYRWWEWEQ